MKRPFTVTATITGRWPRSPNDPRRREEVSSEPILRDVDYETLELRALGLPETIGYAMRMLGATRVTSVHDAIVYELPGSLNEAYEALTAALSGEDGYRRAAATYFKVPYEAVTAEQRQAMKIAFFAQQYGRNPGEIR